MIIDVAPLLAPISDTEPGGVDIRETPEYETVSAEIEKMISPSSSGQIDWQKVETLGARLLATQGKDFMVAAWVAAAWTERYGIEGLAAGLILQEGLVARYWETAFPPLKRLRGRRNALSWWTERTTRWFENKDIRPLREEAHDAMVEAAESLDTKLAELDPESSPLTPFVQQIRRLEVISVASDDEASNTEAPPETAPTGSASATTRAASPGTTLKPFSPAAPAADALNSLDAIIDALAPSMSYVGQITNALRTLDRFNPLAIEMGRFAARGALISLPPAQQGSTSLMPPPVAISDAFATIASSGNADGLIEFCESRIGAFPYWLDLDRESARGFGMLGEPGAAMRQAVVQNVLTFIKRLPGLERLTFSDGTPFADEATLQWLETCKAENSSGGAGVMDRYSRVRQQAIEAFDAGRHEDAMQCYQSLIESTWSGRERFQARLALAELFMGMRGDADALALVAPLAHECRERKLGAWEPKLSLQVWQLYLRAARQALASPALADDEHQRKACQEAIQDAMRELAAIDFVIASKSL